MLLMYKYWSRLTVEVETLLPRQDVSFTGLTLSGGMEVVLQTAVYSHTALAYW